MSDLVTMGRIESGRNHQPMTDPLLVETGSSSRGRASWWPFVIGILAVGALAGGLAAGALPRIRRERELKAEAAEVIASLPRVTVVTARTSGAATERILPGDCHPLLEASIYARTTGYLKSRRVDIGDHVKEGELLAEIAAPEVDAQLEQARATQLLTRANLVRDQATEELAGIELNRSHNLLARQAAPQQEYDAYRAQAKVAAANVKATESTVRVNQANIQRLETLQSFQRVVAPFSGVITARNVDPGDLISADSPTAARELFHLVQIDTLRVFVNVPQVFSTDVKVGQKAVVYRREDRKRTFAGTVTRTADALDPGTRTLLTEVQVANHGMALRPGMYLQVKLVFEREVSTVLVPAAALATRSDGPHLAVLDDRHRVHDRKVQLGRDFGAETEVVADLEAGETVVIHPGDDLPEGAELDPICLPTK
ncbi:MAG: efflux RND transporter periplasmic adaptor subunit [Isosphaeraceae bacterium]